MSNTSVPNDGVALILAGAVAKGAFGAGAVSYMADGGWPIQRLVGTSSGALTAAVIGAGAATGQLAYAAGVAKDLWLNHGAWNDIAHFSLGDWLHVKGLLDTSKLVDIVKEGIERVVGHAAALAAPSAAKVTFITTSLNALSSDPEALPTYEKAIHFDGADYRDPAKWGTIATTAAASATFPGVFAPTMIDGLPYIDGGAVNNAPISYALDDPGVRHVVVVTSESSKPSPVTRVGGIDLVGKVADILINERVSNDLGIAQKTNDLLKAVTAALDETGAAAETKTRVLQALGWRELDLLLIHPEPELTGTSFSGFFDPSLRKTYVEAGERAAEKALDIRRYSAPPT